MEHERALTRTHSARNVGADTKFGQRVRETWFDQQLGGPIAAFSIERGSKRSRVLI